MQYTANKPTSSAIRPGSQVTFKNLPEPIMTVITIDWAANSAVCRYHDTLAHRSIRVECTADTLAPAPRHTEKP